MTIVYDDEPATAPKIVYEERRKPLPAGERLRHASDSWLANMPDFPKGVLEFASGGTGVLRGIVNAPGKIADAVSGPTLSDLVAPGAKKPDLWPSQGDPESGWKTLGSIADPLAWAIGGGVPAAAANTLQKLAASGPAALKIAQGMAKHWAGRAAGRAVVGGATGGTIGALSDEGDAGTGAEIGAAANVVLSPVVSGVTKSAGKIWDVLVGRYGAVRAGQISRAAAGGDLSAIKIATAAAPDDLTATQAAAGVKSDVWDALGELSKRNDKTSFYSRLLEKQKQERIDAMRRLAGGATQTEARQTAEGTQRVLNQITTPMRETELAAANTAGTVGARLQGEASALGEAASGKVADVRGIGRAGEIAERVGTEQPRLGGGAPPIPGLPRTPSQYSYGTELAQLADRIAEKPAAESLILGQASRFKQMQVDSLAEHGLRPLDGGSIIRNLSAKISDPRIGSESIKEKVLTTVRDRLDKWTNSGGVIDASALYGIRKSAVNDAIETLMGGADPKAKSRAAAGLLREVKPLIDDAIEKAGGTGWRGYLKTFEEGMRGVNQQKMGAKALETLEKSPAKFESLAAGNEPKMVEKIFGTEYDLTAAMGDKVRPIEKAAGELARDRSITEGAARGQGGLERILDESSLNFILPNWIDRNIALTNRVLKGIESRLSKSTVEALYAGMRSGKSASKMLSTLPTAEKMTILRELTPYMVGSAASGGAQQ